MRGSALRVFQHSSCEELLSLVESARPAFPPFSSPQHQGWNWSLCQASSGVFTDSGINCSLLLEGWRRNGNEEEESVHVNTCLLGNNGGGESFIISLSRSNILNGVGFLHAFQYFVFFYAL